MALNYPLLSLPLRDGPPALGIHEEHDSHTWLRGILVTKDKKFILMVLKRHHQVSKPMPKVTNTTPRHIYTVCEEFPSKASLFRKNEG